MAISSNTTGLRPGVCTFDTRPTAPYEGQMIYETDTDMVAIWNGSAWRYIAATTSTNGTVLQVVNATYSTQTTTSSSSYSDTGLTATITPKSSSSKILISVSQAGVYKQNDTGVNLRLLRGSTEILVFGGGYTGSSTFINIGTQTAVYLDSPATTSATTYKTQFASLFNIATAGVQNSNTVSTITLAEIAA